MGASPLETKSSHKTPKNPKLLEENMSMNKPNRKNKKQRTGIPGITITAKNDAKPPPDWIMDIPPLNVSQKIEVHEKAIGEKPKDDDTKKKKDLTPAENAVIQTKRAEEANEILDRVMNSNVA